MPAISVSKIPIPFSGGGGTDWTAFWATLLASPNVDVVQWNSIDTIPTTGAYLSAMYSANPLAGDWYLNKYKTDRVLGSRIISQVKLHIKTNTADISNIIFQIWRFDGSTYNRVYSEDIKAQITNVDQVHTVSLTTPTLVQEADLYAMFLRKATAGTTDMCAAIGTRPNGIYYETVDPYTTNPFNWVTQATVINYSQPIYLMGAAPMIVGIGDSLIDSYPLHTSMIDMIATTIDVAKSWMNKMYVSDSRLIYQNCGIGNQQTTAIEARFNRDVVLKKPKLAVINGGVNDIYYGATKATFLAKWTSMLDMCAANDIIPIVWKIMPCNSLDNTEMATRDDWNAALVTLFNAYGINGKKIIDWDSTLGVNRVGGAVGNLWDINPIYAQGDGTHLNEAGQAKLAEVVLAQFA